MTQRTVRKELEDKIITWAASKTPQLKIAFEGVPFEKPLDQNFIEVVLIPAVSANKTLDAKRVTLYGTLQVNIYSPSGKGTKYSEDLAQSLIDFFPVFPKTGTVSIEQTGYIMPALYDAQWRVLPVRITYRQENI